MDNSLFAKLSPELRDNIYWLAIGPREMPMEIGEACGVGIARTCKQMRTECLAMCFSDLRALMKIEEYAHDEFEISQEQAKPGEDFNEDESETDDEGCGSEIADQDEEYEDDESDEEPCVETSIQVAAQRLRLHPKAYYDGSCYPRG